jgi:hypothetical protein
MGRAADGDAPFINIQLVGGSTAEKRQGLKGLKSRTNETFQAGVSCRHQHPSSAITNHGMNAMHRFRDRSAPQADLKGG